MTISPLQIILGIFLLFAISRVVLRLRGGQLTVGEFLFWFGVFTLALAGVVEPGFTSYVAKILGIGRGADVVVYGSLALLYYLIFRTNIELENVRFEVTKLVRLIALQQPQPHEKPEKKKG